jgi:hypothetical protein
MAARQDGGRMLLVSNAMARADQSCRPEWKLNQQRLGNFS